MNVVETTSLNVLNLCVPCYNRCRYCLLSWDGECLGIDYQRSLAYAQRLYDWLKTAHPDIRFVYYFGYSMEHPDLPEAIRFLQKTNSPGGEFLQLDGMKMRTGEELQALFATLKGSGIKLVDFTFYGTREYHDRFAGRKGDFSLMMDSLAVALDKGLEVEVGIPVTKENLGQLDELLALLPEEQIRIFLFTPHSGGRGIHLLDSKITLDDYEAMSLKAKSYFSRKKNRTALEWMESEISPVSRRVLTLSLLPGNIDRLEGQSFEETLKELEKLDEDYYSRIPDFSGLLDRYADPKDRRLYSKKDLYLLYRRRYITENKLEIPDITDERFSGSLRY